MADSWNIGSPSTHIFACKKEGAVREAVHRATSGNPYKSAQGNAVGRFV